MRRFAACALDEQTRPTRCAPRTDVEVRSCYGTAVAVAGDRGNNPRRSLSGATEDDEMETMTRSTEYRDTPEPYEDEFTKTLERYTAQIPSSAMLALAIGAMGLSLLGQLGGRGKWGNFFAQWVPTIISMGIYNKLVKLEGHDRYDRGQGNGSKRQGDTARSAVGISNHPYAEEREEQESLPRRGQARAGA